MAAVSTSHSTVTTVSEVEALAAHLLDPARSRPVCVVTIAWAASGPHIDVAALRAAIGDVCDVVEITVKDLTFRLTELLPDRTGVFDGAARVYSTDMAWQADPYASPLRMPMRLAPDQMLRRLEGDALLAARTAGAFDRAIPKALRVSGVVKGFPHDDRALVQLDDGRLATVPREVVAAEVPFGWVLRAGDRVTGVYARETGRFVPERTAFDPAGIPDGAVVLALVQQVDTDTATLLVHPDLPVRVDREAISANALDTVDLLLTVGDVVTARWLAAGPAARLRDVDDDEPVLPAPPVVLGGPPWLELGRDLPHVGGEPEPLAAPQQPPRSREAAPPPQPPPPAPAPRPVPGPHHVAAARNRDAPAPVARGGPALQQALLRIKQLEHDAVRSTADAKDARATATLADLARREAEAELRETIRQLRDARTRLSARGSALRERERQRAQTQREDQAEDRRDWFATGDDWARFEILLAWAERVQPAEKPAYPLPGYDLDPRFAESVAVLSPSTRRKALRTAVDVLTGRVADISARQAHQLRTGDGGDDPAVVRDRDGAVCWRAYIENKTAQAKRLHWWAVPGGGIELIRVVDHDDVDP